MKAVTALETIFACQRSAAEIVGMKSRYRYSSCTVTTFGSDIWLSGRGQDGVYRSEWMRSRKPSGSAFASTLMLTANACVRISE